jgi:hypothetical protein
MVTFDCDVSSDSEGVRRKVCVCCSPEDNTLGNAVQNVSSPVSTQERAVCAVWCIVLDGNMDVFVDCR